MGIFEIVMSSAVLAALIGWIRGNKEDQLNYITGERSVWRKEMKECIEGLQTCRLKDIDKWLIKLKVNLNGYGCHNSGEYPEDMYLDFLRDEHIWKVIDEIETEHRKADYSERKIKHQKDKLIRLIVILLKFEWEKSKREVKANRLLFISLSILTGYVLIVCYFLFNIFSRRGEDTVTIISSSIVLGGTIIILYVITWLPNIVEQIKATRGKIRYKKVKRPLFYWLIGLLCEGMIVYALNLIIKSPAVSVASVCFFISLLIPIYQSSKEHQFYTEYDQSVIEILKLNTLTAYYNEKDKKGIRVIEDLMDKGINNYKIERKLETFLRDESFKNFVKNEPLESMLIPTGVKKYKKLQDLQRDTGTELLSFVSNNPSLCKCFFRYVTDNEIKYGLAEKETIEKWK